MEELMLRSLKLGTVSFKFFLLKKSTLYIIDAQQGIFN